MDVTLSYSAWLSCCEQPDELETIFSDSSRVAFCFATHETRQLAADEQDDGIALD